MGEYAEMMLDGTCCQSCGEYLFDDDQMGIPSYCGSCAPDDFVGKVDGEFRDAINPSSDMKKRAPARVRRSKGNMDSIEGNVTALNKVVNVDPSAVDLKRLQKQIRRMQAMENRILKALRTDT